MTLCWSLNCYMYLYKKSNILYIVIKLAEKTFDCLLQKKKQQQQNNLITFYYRLIHNYFFFSNSSSCIDSCPNFFPIRSCTSKNLATHLSKHTASPFAISASLYTGGIHFLWHAVVSLLYMSAIISISSSWMSCSFCCSLAISVFEVMLFTLTGRFQDSLLFTLFHLLVTFLDYVLLGEVKTVDACYNTHCPGKCGKCEVMYDSI